MFLVKSNNKSNKIADFQEKRIDLVEQDAISEAVSSCLEEPFFRWLDKWNKELKTKLPNKQAVFILREIENIRKQITLHQRNKVTKGRSKSVGNEKIVPTRVKDYLYGYLSI